MIKKYKKYSLTEISNSKMYSDELFKILKSILGSPKSFIKSNNKRKNYIYKKLNELCVLKDHSEIFNVEDKNTYKIRFHDEYKIFEEIMNNQFEKEITRKDSGVLINQLIISFEYIKNILYDNGYISENYVNIKEEVDLTKIFNMIIESSLSSLEYIHIDQNSRRLLNIEDNEIDQIKLFENLTTKIIYKLALILLSKNELVLSSGLYFINDNIESIKKNKINSSLEKLAYQFIEIFIDIFKCEVRNIHYFNESNLNRSIKLIKLPDNLTNSFISSNHIPEILPISNDFTTTKDFIISSKKIKSGVSNIELSEDTLKTLRISQKKKFIINEKAINLFKKIDELEYNVVKNIDSLPFVPINQIKKIIDDVNYIEQNNSFSNDEIYKVMKIRYKDNIDISQELNFSEEKVNEIIKYVELINELEIKIRSRKLFNTILEFAEIFNGFPIFFMESFDYRLRMYTVKDIFSRTTGIRKYLIKEYESIKLDETGLKSMLLSFYNNYNVEKYELEKLIKENKSIDYIMKWNNENIEKIDDNEIILNDDSYFYRLLLKEEIKSLEKNNMKTGFMIEIDQKTSGLVITSIITGDIELAKHCNLISVNKEKKDAATMVMNRSYDFFKGKISDDALNELSNNREIHKKLQMFALYNQKTGGRLRVLNDYKFELKDKSTIAKLYDTLLNNTYENLSTKREKINNIIKFYIKKTNKPIEVNTIDGSKITWYIFNNKNEDIISKYQSPITSRYKSFRSRKKMIDEANIQKMVISFLPSYIHSIDGGIMRLLISMMYEKHKYIITHLHDSIQFHPNHYKNILDCITEIYTSDSMKNQFEENVFNMLKSRLIPQYHSEFDYLLSILKDESFKELEINKDSFHPENMYPFE